MATITYSNFTVQWLTAIVAVGQDGEETLVRGPAEAVQFLIRNACTQAYYRQALQACRSSIRGEIHPSLARALFLTAVEEPRSQAVKVPHSL